MAATTSNTTDLDIPTPTTSYCTELATVLASATSREAKLKLFAELSDETLALAVNAPTAKLEQFWGSLHEGFYGDLLALREPPRPGRRARIRQLRESIARRALGVVRASVDARILQIVRLGSVLIVATEEPSSRWSRFAVDTFRLPTADDTDPDFDEGRAPKRWVPLAGWGGDGVDEVPGMLAKATAYAAEVQGSGVAR
ncbi:hypothetical protein [Streptomyces bangladeshensis]|uniref:Uncharacterized protein n=1 Tax=Streptomyces bangladeshensis TaxID=295352 RepID=A0ABP5N3Y1_9ACTN